MKRRIPLAALLLLCLALQIVSLASCHGGTESFEKFSTYSFEYFDTVTSIVGYEKTQEDFDRVSGEILAQLRDYHRLFTIYHRYEGMENLCTVNDVVDGAHRTVKVDRRILDLLLYAREMHGRTGGKVNIAMGSVLSIWHDYRQEGSSDPSAAKLPPMERLEEAAKHTDITNMVIDEAACTVTLTDPAMRLDVGAIAKGYAVEMVGKWLEAQGVTGYVLNVGGNVRTVGVKGDGEKWIAGIENPRQDEGEPYLAYLALAGESLVTSGSYQRYYVVNGKAYHHIIDPDTLMPREGYLSVSVVCKSSADGDALSTALFCMSPEEGLALVNALPDVEAMWVLSDGTRRTSPGFADYTTTFPEG